MSRSIAPDPVKTARRKIIKKMTGHERDTMSCTGCGRQFADREIDSERIIFSVSKTSSVAFCPKCFKQNYTVGGAT